MSYGNRIDVDEADLLAYLADDEETRVIACYVEGFEAGHKFLETARQLSKRKPIVVYKAGLFSTGLEGGSVPYGLPRWLTRRRGRCLQTGRAGLHAVDSFEELCAVSTDPSPGQPLARGPRIAMISNGAGTMVQALDLAVNRAEMDDLSNRLSTSSERQYPPFIGGEPGGCHRFRFECGLWLGLAALLRDENVDIVMPWFVSRDTPLDEGIVDVLDELNETAGKPIVRGTIGGNGRSADVESHSETEGARAPLCARIGGGGARPSSRQDRRT